MKTLKNYIDSVVNKVLRESLEEKADEIIDKIKSNVEESDDHDQYDEYYMGEGDEFEGETCEECGGMMREGECSECGYTMEGIYESKSETCEECGGMMSEGECSECGYKMEDIYEMDMESDFDPSEKLERVCNEESEEYSKQACVAHKRYHSEMTEKSETKEGKKFPDLSGDGKVTRKDVLMGRGVKLNGNKTKKRQTDEEMEEGNAFTGALAKAKRKGNNEFEVDGKKYQVKESIKLTEEEMIDFIEKIVNEEKDNIRKQSSHPGISTTKKSLGKSKDENEKYIKSVTKKMKDYLKDGSKGDFDFEPKIFPKGNGELGEMKKKIYKPTKEVEEYIENFSSAGQENLVFDEIHPNEEKMDEYMEGSSKAGNNPKWANAVETDVNKKRNNVRKRNLLGILKKKEGYNRQPQPVYDSKKDSEDEKDVARIFQALESKEDKKEKVLKEEIQKMNHLLVYNKKTQ